MNRQKVIDRYEAAMDMTPLGAADALDELVAEMHDYHGDRSDKWQDSERGIEWESVTSDIEEKATLIREAAEFMPEFFAD